MNRLLFSEGGQPVGLDDLQELQLRIENLFDGFLGLLRGLKINSAFLSPYTVRSSAGDKFIISAGRIFFYDGYAPIFCDFDGGSFDKEEGVDTVYVCIDKSDRDERLFKDGKNRPCRSFYSARLSVTPSGSFKNYDIFELDYFRISKSLLTEL